MLYYNNYLRSGSSMTHHHTFSPSISPSILRLSVWQRLTAAVLLVAGLWGVIYWAMAA